MQVLSIGGSHAQYCGEQVRFVLSLVMEWIQAVIAQFAYIDTGTFCVWESHRILSILRENVKHASTA